MILSETRILPSKLLKYFLVEVGIKKFYALLTIDLELSNMLFYDVSPTNRNNNNWCIKTAKNNAFCIYINLNRCLL